MLVASKKITNTEHSYDAHLLLRRMVIHVHFVLVKRGSEHKRSTAQPHIPDISTFEGALDLFMLCIVMELGDLVNPLAYRKKKYHHERDRDRERLSTIHARGLSRDLVAWWHANYEFFKPGNYSVVHGKDLFNELLLQHMKALVSYKREAEKNKVEGEVKECTAELLERLLKKYFPFVHLEQIEDKGFEWARNGYQVRAQQGAESSFVRSGFFYSSPWTQSTYHQWQVMIFWSLVQLLWIWTLYRDIGTVVWV